MNIKKKIYIITWHKILPIDSGHALRVINIAKMLNEQFDVTILSINHKKEINYKEINQDYCGINVVQKDFSDHYPQYFYNFSSLINSYPVFYPKIVKDFFFDLINDDAIIQIESLRLYKLFHKKFKKIILDEHNIEWERMSFKEKFPKNILKLFWKLTSKSFEKKAIVESKVILVTSDRDKELIKDEMKKINLEKILVIPNCLDKKDYSLDITNNDLKIKEKYGKKPIVLFMGSQSYFPNQDAIEQIINKIAVKLKTVQFLIVGGGADFSQYKKLDNVIFTGYVDDVHNYIRISDICICPLRYGAGTRLKILEYLVFGKPTISTSKGAEGLNITHNENILIEDNIDNYCNLITNLLENKKTYRNLEANSKKFIYENFDWRVYSKMLNKKIIKIF